MLFLSGELMVDELEYVVVSGGLMVLREVFNMIVVNLFNITGCINNQYAVKHTRPKPSVNIVKRSSLWKKTVNKWVSFYRIITKYTRIAKLKGNFVPELKMCAFDKSNKHRSG